MTTFGSTKEVCFVCGETSTHRVITSSNQLQSSDLDTRPGEMYRSTIAMWVQVCPSCGYCATRLSQGSPGAAEIVRSDAYQQQLTSPAYPALANHFLCNSLILESSGEFGKAGWASLHAAWVCDDKQKRGSYRPPEDSDPGEDDPLISPVPGQEVPKNGHGQADASQNCRKRAIALFLQTRENDQSFATGNGVEEAIIADLYRRIGNFQGAMDICQVGLGKDLDDRTRKVLLFQDHLSDIGDSKTYTLADAERSG